MKTFREDFTNIIKDLKQTNECQEIRKLIHKLVGLASLLNDSHVELTFILKISGIWENNHNYGLTYKFIKIHQ